MLAGIGAVALAGAFVAPGVAAAAPSGSLGSLGSSGGEGAAPEATETGVVSYSPDERVTVAATGYDNCTIDFTLGAKNSDAINWVADFRVDGEDAKIDGGEGEFFDVYRPVVTNQADAAQALNDKYSDKYGWNVAVDENTVNLDDLGIAPTEDGTHTVTFKMYRGSPAGGWAAAEEKGWAGPVTVTGCETTAGTALGSLDLFGSLGSLFGTEK
ncbi:hypothetical protein GCM10023353_30800 [Tomitella cavernea]|uniref:Peptidase n=2 Tax=Tomitella cavernea TaxID=1387982 RepID=A0ABP9CW68_9ACTN